MRSRGVVREVLDGIIREVLRLDHVALYAGKNNERIAEYYFDLMEARNGERY